MSETPRDRVLVDLWRTGDQQAARELVDCYIDRLLSLARRRISQRLASRIDPEDVWVVGDTPRDLEAARAAGAHCVLVATGRFTLPEAILATQRNSYG